MPEASIHQPHDKLFKAGFSDPVAAASFLREQFSSALSIGDAVWEEKVLVEVGRGYEDGHLGRLFRAAATCADIEAFAETL